MRIIAGQHRGLILTDVGAGDAAAHLRPTGDRVRESLFNVLSGGRFGSPVNGARVLDLFAGTGALGREALSRGATHATFVENGAVGLQLIRDNIARTGRGADTQILKLDATALPATKIPYTLIFLDPPYGKSLGALALKSAATSGWIAKGAIIVWEDNTAQIPPKGFTRLDHRTYGDTHITLLQAD